MNFRPETACTTAVLCASCLEMASKRGVLGKVAVVAIVRVLVMFLAITALRGEGKEREVKKEETPAREQDHEETRDNIVLE